MILTEALAKIEELETKLACLEKESLNADDKSYIDKLKDDMRKAAAKREQSEKEKFELAEEFNSHKLNTKVKIEAIKSGCIDVDTFVQSIKDTLPESKTSEEDFSEWFTGMKTKYAYFFGKEKKTDQKPKMAPLVPKRNRQKATMSTFDKAASLYKTN